MIRYNLMSMYTNVIDSIVECGTNSEDLEDIIVCFEYLTDTEINFLIQYGIVKVSKPLGIV